MTTKTAKAKAPKATPLEQITTFLSQGKSYQPAVIAEQLGLSASEVQEVLVNDDKFTSKSGFYYMQTGEKKERKPQAPQVETIDVANLKQFIAQRFWAVVGDEVERPDMLDAVTSGRLKKAFAVQFEYNTMTVGNALDEIMTLCTSSLVVDHDQPLFVSNSDLQLGIKIMERTYRSGHAELIKALGGIPHDEEVLQKGLAMMHDHPESVKNLRWQLKQLKG